MRTREQFEAEQAKSARKLLADDKNENTRAIPWVIFLLLRRLSHFRGGKKQKFFVLQVAVPGAKARHKMVMSSFSGLQQTALNEALPFAR